MDSNLFTGNIGNNIFDNNGAKIECICREFIWREGNILFFIELGTSQKQYKQFIYIVVTSDPSSPQLNSDTSSLANDS